jgi:outer membrane autotransporter protein
MTKCISYSKLITSVSLIALCSLASPFFTSPAFAEEDDPVPLSLPSTGELNNTGDNKGYYIVDDNTNYRTEALTLGDGITLTVDFDDKSGSFPFQMQQGFAMEGTSSLGMTKGSIVSYGDININTAITGSQINISGASQITLGVQSSTGINPGSENLDFVIENGNFDLNNAILYHAAVNGDFTISNVKNFELTDSYINFGERTTNAGTFKLTSVSMELNLGSIVSGSAIQRFSDGDIEITGTSEKDKQSTITLNSSKIVLANTKGDIVIDYTDLTLSGNDSGKMASISVGEGEHNISISDSYLELSGVSTIVSPSKNTGNISLKNVSMLMGVDDGEDTSHIYQEGTGDLTISGKLNDNSVANMTGTYLIEMNAKTKITMIGHGNLNVSYVVLKDYASIENTDQESGTSSKFSFIELNNNALIRHQTSNDFSLTNGLFLDNSQLIVGNSDGTTSATDMIINASSENKTGFYQNSGIYQYTPGNIVFNGGTINLGTEDSDAVTIFMTNENSAINIAGSDVNIGNVSFVKERIDDENVLWENGVNWKLDSGSLTLKDSSTFTANNLTVGGDFQLNGNDITMNINGTAEFSGTFTAEGTSWVISETLAKNLTFNTGSLLSLKSLEIQAPVTMYDLTVSSGLNLGSNVLTLENNLTLGKGAVVSVNIPKSATTTAGEVITDPSVLHGRINANAVTITDTAQINITIEKWTSLKNEGTIFKFIETTEALEADKFTMTNNRYNFAQIKCPQGNGLCYVATLSTDGSDATKAMGGDSNQVAIAKAYLDGVAFPSGTEIEQVAGYLEQLSQSTDTTVQASYLNMLSLVAPDTIGLTRQTAFNNQSMLIETVANRLGNPSFHAYSGLNSGDKFANSGFWAQGYFNHTNKKQEDKVLIDAFRSQTVGGAVGIDVQLAQNVLGGIGYSYNKSSVKLEGHTRKNEIEMQTAFVYAKYQPNNFFIDVIGSYGWGEQTDKKKIALASSILDGESTFDMTSYGAQLEIGYDVAGLALTPVVGVRYYHLEQDAYTDFLGQKISENKTDTITAVAQIRYGETYEFSSRSYFYPEIRIGGTYDIKSDKGTTLVSLPNGSTYTVEGEEPSKAAFTAGVGITFEIDGSYEFSLGYDLEIRKKMESHTASAKVKIYF